MENEIKKKKLTPLEYMGESDEDIQVDDLEEIERVDEEELEEQKSEEGIIQKKMSDEVNDSEESVEEGVDDSDEQDEPEEQGSDEEIDDEDVEVKLKGNITQYAAEAMKDKGALPEDFEITEDITEEELDQALIKYKEEPLRNEIRKEELNKLREEEGFTEKMIDEVKYRHGGVQDEELQELNLLKIMSGYEFDENSDTFEKDASEFLKSYYSLSNVPERRVDDLVKEDLNDDEIFSILSDYQKELGQKAVQKEQQFKEEYQNKVEEKRKKRKKRREREKELIKKGKIGDFELNEEEREHLNKALNEKTEVVKGRDGKYYRTTLYNKRMLEASQDEELRLLHKAFVVLGLDLKKFKNEEREKANKNINKRLNKYVEINSKSNKKQSTKNKKSSDSGKITNEQGIVQKAL